MDKTHLIGPAARVDGILHLMADEVMGETNESIKVLLYGAPGVGKTEISNRLAAKLTDSSPFAVESINGKELDLARVKQWRFNNPDKEKFESFVNSFQKAIMEARAAIPRNDSLAGEISRLKELFDEGTLSEDQFEAAKNRLTGNGEVRKIGF